MTDIRGKVTAETVLSQCMRMSENSDLDAFFSFSGHINNIHVYVNYKTMYGGNDGPNTIYNSMNGFFPSLAETLSDLIKIQNEYTGERNE